MINFSNMLHKPLRHAFIPADQKAVTFVFEDGMRRSFGLKNPEGRFESLSAGFEGATFVSVELEAYLRLRSTDNRDLIVAITGAATTDLTELPE